MAMLHCLGCLRKLKGSNCVSSSNAAFTGRSPRLFSRQTDQGLARYTRPCAVLACSKLVSRASATRQASSKAFTIKTSPPTVEMGIPSTPIFTSAFPVIRICTPFRHGLRVNSSRPSHRGHLHRADIHPTRLTAAKWAAAVVGALISNVSNQHSSVGRSRAMGDCNGHVGAARSCPP